MVGFEFMSAQRQECWVPDPDELEDLKIRLKYAENAAFLSEQEKKDATNKYLDILAEFRKKNEELEKLKQALEDRVLQRTDELRTLNQALKDESVRHKQTIQSLRASEERFRQMAESIKEVFWLVDAREASLQYISPAFEEIWGHPVARAYEDNKLCIESLHPEDRERIARFFTPHYVSKEPDVCEFRVIKPDGSMAWVRNRMFPVCDEKEQVIKWVGIAEDITRQKLAEEDRLRLEQQVQRAQKLESLGVLAGGIAHDFNNILMALMCYTDMALKKLTPEDPIHGYMKKNIKAIHRASDLVKQILQFSRRSDQKRKPLQVGLIVKEALSLLSSTLPSFIDIQHVFKDGQSKIMADPSQIHQVIMNLCTNAAHAMHEHGGTLTVRLEEVELSAADLVPDLQGLEPGSYVRLQVSDTGPGIDPGCMSRIFDPFFTTKRVGEGTGLGLSVVHGIVKDLNGEVLVESRVGDGANFIVFLPRLDREIEEDPAPAPVCIIPRDSGNILFIDDEQNLVDIGRHMLESLGFVAVATTSSIEALSLFSEDPMRFDMVITDQTMPRLTGIELARKCLVLRPDLPIILCTGYSEQVTSEDAKKAGIARFLMKPISIANIAEAIHHLFSREVNASIGTIKEHP